MQKNAVVRLDKYIECISPWGHAAHLSLEKFWETFLYLERTEFMILYKLKKLAWLILFIFLRQEIAIKVLDNAIRMIVGGKKFYENVFNNTFLQIKFKNLFIKELIQIIGMTKLNSVIKIVDYLQFCI